jgi:hypothetical protein
MRPHTFLPALCLVLFLFTQLDAQGQRRAPTGGRIAVVVDERLAALRATPHLNGKLVRRLGRGRLVAIRSSKTDSSGITFFFVNVTTRTRGWIQRESVVSPSRPGDDQRLLNLIRDATAFDRIVRCRIFLDHFRRSPLRPQVLLLLGDTAEDLAIKLSQSISRKLNSNHLSAPESTYYLNHPSLDRYNRQNVHFLFNPVTKRLHYDGLAWRLILRHHPHSPEASVARQRLKESAKHFP